MPSIPNRESDITHPVVFTTQTPYTLPAQKFMIPATWKRYHLSQLVNKALSLTSPVPFDFLVQGEILRGTLGEWCAEKGIEEEQTLEIEYFESVMPPQKMSSLPHVDWVSSVICQLQGHFLSASYDGIIRVFDYSQKLSQSVQAHEAPISSCALISRPLPDQLVLATASHDLTARILQLTLDQLSPSSGQIPHSKTLASLHLHTSALSSISSNTSGSHLLTSSWDTLIGVWDTIIPTADEVPLDVQQEPSADRKKRRKLDDDDDRPKRKAPLAVLKSHTARVSKAVFSPDSTKLAYSAGFDSTIRTWDVDSGICTRTISVSSKPFLDLAVSPDGNSVFASSTDRTVSHYDIRESTTTSPISSFLHPSTPSCVALPRSTSPSSAALQFVSGSYDGVVRIWDTRSVKTAVTSFKAWEGGKKILSVDWGDSVIAIGGQGGVEIWRVGQGDRVADS